MPGTPPYSIGTPAFPFPALASLAGRAPTGGERELALGCFVAIRLAAGVLAPHPVPVATRAERSAGARTWVASLALPTAARAAFVKVADAAGGDDVGLVHTAMARFLGICAPVLDGASRQEVDRFMAEFPAGD